MRDGDAEDAAQTTFLLAQRALARGVVPGSETNWLITIAQNVCLNRHRERRRRGVWEHARAPEELDRVPRAEPERVVDVEALKEALAELPEQQRHAILLREWQGRTYAEIEQELGLGKAAVETLIFRGRRALAQRLEGRLRALDGLSLASMLKGLLGGGAAAKAGAAAAVAVVAAAGIAVETRDGGKPPAAPTAVRPEQQEPVEARAPAPRLASRPASAVAAPTAQQARAAAAAPLRAVPPRADGVERSAPAASPAAAPATAPPAEPVAAVPVESVSAEPAAPAPATTRAAVPPLQAPAAEGAVAPVAGAVDETVAGVVAETGTVAEETVAAVNETAAVAGVAAAAATPPLPPLPSPLGP